MLSVVRHLGLAALLFAVSPAAAQPTTAASATPEDSPGRIRLTWQIDSAQDNYGFFLNRSDSPDGPWTRVNEQLIPGVGTTSDVHKFEYWDTGLVRGRDYYYQLMEVSLSNEIVDKTAGTPLVAHCRTVTEEIVYNRHSALGAVVASMEEIQSPLASGDYVYFFHPRTREDVLLISSWEASPSEMVLLPLTQFLISEQRTEALPATGEYFFQVGADASMELHADEFNPGHIDSAEHNMTVSLFRKDAPI